jgi:hypothetical protein
MEKGETEINYEKKEIFVEFFSDIICLHHLALPNAIKLFS